MAEGSISATVLKLAAVLLLVLANGFFVATEFALVGIRKSRVATLVAEGNKRARILMGILNELDAYISATQLGITLASLGLGWIAEATLAQLLTPLFHAILPASASEVAAHSVAVAAAFTIITFLHIALGELAPKTLALERTESVALAVSRPIQLFYRLFKAPIWLLNRAGIFIVHLFGLHATAEHATSYNEEELRHLIALSHKSGHLIEDEQELITNVFDFTDKTVESVMTPRTEIEGLDIELTPAEMLEQIEQLGYSRMPVYRDSLDNVIGVLLYKDLSRVLRNGEAVTLEQLMRPPVFLPTTVKLHDALRSLRASSGHMAMVVDEHGGVEGLVTIEDLVEEIVGDIRDEHDEIALRQVVEQADGSYLVSGRLSIKDANKLLDFSLPEADSYHTIAGFMMARAGRLLNQGESVQYNDLRLTVESSAKNRIIETRIEKLNQETAPTVSAGQSS